MWPWLLLLVGCGGGQDDGSTPEAPVSEDARFAGLSQSRLDPPLEIPIAGDAAAAAPFVAEARRLFEVRRLKECAAALSRALEIDPGDGVARQLHGEVLLLPGGQHDASLALQEFRLARLTRPVDFALLLGEARARCELEDDGRALALFEEAERRVEAGAPLTVDQRLELHCGRGQLAYRAGDFPTALLRFDQALAGPPGGNASTRRRVMYERALTLEQLGRLEEADRQLVEVIASRPEEGRLHFARARVLRRAGQEEAAARESEIHQLLNPFEDDASRRFRTDHERRIELRRRLVEVYPEFARARHLLVREYLDARQAEQAIGEARRILADDRGDGEALFLLARGLALAGQLDEAREAAERLRATGTVTDAVVEDLLAQIGEAGDGR